MNHSDCYFKPKVGYELVGMQKYKKLNNCILIDHT